MIRDEDSSNGSGLEPTKIDLGDDLIEKTAIVQGLPAPTPPPADDSSNFSSPLNPVADQMHSAQILLGERMPEEAKKILRQILISDPSQVEAKKLLEQIHESELKQMFSSGEMAVRKSFSSTYDESILDADSEEIIRILDRDFEIGGLDTEHAAKGLSFFSDVKLLTEFADKVDRDLGDAASDRVDLSIGFIEMGLYPVAIRLLQSLMVCGDEGQRLSACNLVAHAHIMNNEGYRAISVLQPVLNDGEIDKFRKTESFYLMGRAQQLNGAFTEALSWLLQAQAIEPGYRDSAERIAHCMTALGK